MKDMNLLSVIGLAIGVILIIVDKIIYTLPDGLALAGYAAAAVLIIWGGLKKNKENSGR
ncbi:MAG: hypothetical protein IIZ48_00590 [Erysipelotrichales bacterium]|nr:hypothetical protein [Erysipelotrichales bacterium]